MKLRDLRELYEAPKTDLDDLDGPDGLDGVDEREPVPLRAVFGFDPAYGADSTALRWRCDRCAAHHYLKPPPKKAVFIPLCPTCDACPMCGQCYDENCDPLPVNTVVVMRRVEGEIVPTKAKLCDACVERANEKLCEVLFGRT